MWLGEHHFGPYGVGDLPNPILLGADLAARTSRIRIGQMANIAPWWHPIRLAEDLSILDNMTRGRIEVGFGRGIWPYEGPQFHVNADPRKDEKNRELFRETVEIVRKIWSDPYFSHEGPQLQVPSRRHRVLSPIHPAGPGMAGRGAGDPAPDNAQALPEATPSPVDDRVHRWLSYHRGGYGTWSLLLAAPGREDPAENGTLCRRQIPVGGSAVQLGREPSGDAFHVRRVVHGGSQKGGRDGDHVVLLLQ